MARALAAKGSRAPLVVIAAAALTVIAVEFVSPGGTRVQDVVSDAVILGSALLSAALILWNARGPGPIEGRLPFAAAMLTLALAKAIDILMNLSGPPGDSTSSTDLFFLIIGALFLIPVRTQFHHHFEDADRREIWADVALIAAALIGPVYLALRPVGADQELAAIIWAAIFAATTAAAITAYAAVVMWVPTRVHFLEFAVVGAFTGATLAIGSAWIRNTSYWGNAALDLTVALASLALAAVVWFKGRVAAEHRQVENAGWGRAALTTAAVLAASASLGIVSTLRISGSATSTEATILFALLAAAVGARILVNQVRSIQAYRETRRALKEKESALHGADQAMVQLQDALETLKDSEERLRVLFDAASDGIVEIDGNGVIRRSNDAFCAMVTLDRDFVVGREWDEVARSVDGADASLVSLPETGQTTLSREGHSVFLEARTSEIPGENPGRLLLVRDVTATKVAEQTIRSLFKFLQDRDEDRTRLLKRTNTAIESERNRVARDLHDGPVQGVSAASLSLEAVLLMIKGEDIPRARDTLVKVRNQLSEEADNLRHLMGNLRPPLLEERGLIPALQETVSRFGRDAGLETSFRSRALVDLPPDIETLAYRLVQEALSNAGKHSKARKLSVSVDAVAGQLRIEIGDDGIGFDPSNARDFLRMGKVGLASMRERIELASGTFMVRSSHGGGTTIIATLPLETIPAASSMMVE
ncbi:MAG: PAS domain-containing sensor histidine kinase [Actinomycetota bacterium]